MHYGAYAKGADMHALLREDSVGCNFLNPLPLLEELIPIPILLSRPIFLILLIGLKQKIIFTVCWAACAQSMYACFALNLQAIVTGGIGVMQNIRKINGSSQTAVGNLFFLTANTAELKFEGGIFTQPSNIGKSKQNTFGGMLEVILRAGYCVCERVELSLGYNVILLTSVARAADLIDRRINTTRTTLAAASRATVGVGPGPIPFGMPGPAPAPSGDTSPVLFCRTKSFVTQGLIAGLMIYF